MEVVERICTLIEKEDYTQDEENMHFINQGEHEDLV
jgi:hypothetical protein